MNRPGILVVADDWRLCFDFLNAWNSVNNLSLVLQVFYENNENKCVVLFLKKICDKILSEDS